MKRDIIYKMINTETGEIRPFKRLGEAKLHYFFANKAKIERVNNTDGSSKIICQKESYTVKRVLQSEQA